MTDRAAGQTPIRVVGAGLSGLAAAWFLSERGRAVHVDEAGSRAGGLLRTTRTPEGLVETAARGFLRTPNVAALFAGVGIKPLFAGSESKRRYIFRAGRPRRWPLTGLETVSAALHGTAALLTRRAKARDSESVEAWGHRVLGRAGTQWMLAPALQGIYASPLAALSATATIGKGRVRGKLVTAPDGMGQLIDRLVATLRTRGVTIRFDSPVNALEPGIPTIVATSSPVAAALVAPYAPTLASALGRIPMSHLFSVTAFFRPHPGDVHGFGILFPRNASVPVQETVRALGVLFNSDMFAGRGEFRSETWIYGSGSSDEIAMLRSTIATTLINDRQVVTGRRDTPVASYPTLSAQRLPVYGPEIPGAMAHLSELPSWLTVCGNYTGQIGVSALVDVAERAAARAALAVGG